MRNPEATSKTPLHPSPHLKQHRSRSKASKGVNRQRICPLGNAANTYPSREELRAMRCRDVFDTFGRRHTTTTRRNYADCCAQTGSEPVPSQSVAGRGRWNAWLPLFPNTQAQRPTSFPKDASLRKPLLALPAERLAGRANGQRRTGTKTSERRRHTPHTQTHNHPSALSGNPLAATPNNLRGGVWRDCAFLLHTTAARAAIAVAHASLARLLRLLFTRTSAAAWHRGERGRGEEGSGSPQVGSDPPGTLSWACCGLCRRSSLGSSRGSLSAPGTNWACTWPASTCW